MPSLRLVFTLALLLGAAPLWADGEAGELVDHWAFRPFKGEVPGTRPAAGPIDRFVGARLADQGLELGPEADRRRLIRRAYLVLHGLAPTPAELAAQLASPHPGWYERLVDELLASPRFGERFGRHWLDVARYAESNGYETNRPRPNAWPYRDWVIRSFNEDLPFADFVSAQIAGDRTGHDEATGFLVAGPYDIVKSPDPELTLMQRADEVADFVNATSSAFLGLTVACARCHDHKFDPISQVDYYALSAIFAGVTHGERSYAPPRLTPTDEERRELSAKIRRLEEKVADSGLRPPVDHQRNTDRFAPVEARVLRFTVLATTGGQPCIDELEVWSAATEEAPAKNLALASGGAIARASGTLPGYAIHQLHHLNDGRYGNGRSWISNTSGGGWVEIEFPRRVRIERVVWGRDRELRFRDRLATAYRIEVKPEPGSAGPDDPAWTLVADASDRLPLSVAASETRLADPQSRFDPARVAATRALVGELAELRARLPKLSSSAKAWAGTFRQPGPVHLLIRGDPSTPGEVVRPGTLARFGELQLPDDAPEAERRAALARWIAHADNVLAARVHANRLWQYVFGQGLVTTPNDFGRNGARPSHPALLDWLASELVMRDGSVKSLVREMLLSRSFRQSSAPRARPLAVDASNRLLWRFSPRRLEAEAIRDRILAVAGSLDLRLGGPGYEMVVAQPANVYNYETKREFAPEDFRRSVYAHQIRGEQDGTFGAFDCPDGGQIAPRRARSTTALQALNLLNGPFLVEQARLAAARLERERAEEREAQVLRAFSLAYGRAPDPVEREGALRLTREHGLAALCRALLNSSEFLFIE